MTKITDAQYDRFRDIMMASGHTKEHIAQANYPHDVIMHVLESHNDAEQE